MNKRLPNVLLIFLGFIVHLLFARSPQWDIVAVIGSFVAAVGLVNLSFGFLPIRHTIADWLVPAIVLVAFAGLTFILLDNSYLGLQGIWLYSAQSLLTILTLAPLARLYLFLVKYREQL